MACLGKPAGAKKHVRAETHSAGDARLAVTAAARAEPGRDCCNCLPYSICIRQLPTPGAPATWSLRDVRCELRLCWARAVLCCAEEPCAAHLYVPDFRSLRLVLPPSITGQVLAMPLPLTCRKHSMQISTSTSHTQHCCRVLWAYMQTSADMSC